MFDSADNESLGAEIADCDGGLVGFVEGAFCFFAEDAFGEDGGALDGEEGNVEFFGVGGGHGCDVSCEYDGIGGADAEVGVGDGCGFEELASED